MDSGKIKALPMWDWTVLVAAWRYYEYRNTIAANQFPEDIVERYWGKDGMRIYGDEVRDTIARQFALVDHGSRGEMDWDDETPISSCDTKVWRKFYWFCRAWATRSFVKLSVSNGEITEVVETFSANGRIYPKDRYIEAPGRECYIPLEFVKEKK